MKPLPFPFPYLILSTTTGRVCCCTFSSVLQRLTRRRCWFSFDDNTFGWTFIVQCKPDPQGIRRHTSRDSSLNSATQHSAMDKATRISTIAKPATSYEAQHKARVVSLDIPPPVPPKDPPRPATSSTTRSGPAKRPVANATTKLKGATMSSRPTTSSTRPGTTSTLAGTMSSIQGAGSKIKAGLRPLKLAALTSHPTRPMPTISRPQTASNTTVASPVRPTTSSTRRFSRSTTMTGRTIKYGSGRYATTELSPQPSDDEDDPLVRTTRTHFFLS